MYEFKISRWINDIADGTSKNNWPKCTEEDAQPSYDKRFGGGKGGVAWGRVSEITVSRGVVEKITDIDSTLKNVNLTEKKDETI